MESSETRGHTAFSGRDSRFACQSDNALIFKKLQLSDVPIIRQYTELSHNRGCDNTLGCIFIWRDLFKTEYAVFRQTLVFKSEYPSDGIMFSMPLGKHVNEAIAAVIEYCKVNSLTVKFGSATKEDIELYDTLFSSEKLLDTRWSDYVYDSSALSYLKGKRYNGQRNHINYFERTYPDWEFRRIDGSNAKQVLSFFCSNGHIAKKHAHLYMVERSKVCEILENFDYFNLPGGAVYLNDQSIAAFAVGEIVHDTLYVHIEKADVSIRGAYQMIVREFSKHFGANVTYINREDDAGDEGLRISKRSYHPIMMVDKYTVIMH